MNKTICITSILNTNKSNEVRCIRVHLIMLYLWIFSNKSEQLETHLVSTFCVSIHDLCAQTSSTNECEHIVFTKIHFSILYFGTCMLKRFIWNVLFVIRMNTNAKRLARKVFSVLTGSATWSEYSKKKIHLLFSLACLWANAIYSFIIQSGICVKYFNNDFHFNYN